MRRPGRSSTWSVIGLVGILAVGAAVLTFHASGNGKPVLGNESLGNAKRCQSFAGLPVDWPKDVHAGMVQVHGGSFEMGSRKGYPDERPQGPVNVQSFWMDQTEVTNAQFATFVAATRYVTEAERQGGGAVFRMPNQEDEASGRPYPWWRYSEGANWKHPEGPGSDVRGRDNQPVILVTLADALAYAKWLGRDLPTEAEWEYAGKAGRPAQALDEVPRDAAGHPAANYWQGIFPNLNTGEDGYAALAPVGCFAANPYGLYDMIGNAWEWTRDPYSGPHQPHGNGDPATSLPVDHKRGPSTPMVIKGGSYLCAENYCMRYRAAARYEQEADLGASHIGFRTILR